MTKGACYVCMSSSELDTLQRAFRAAGGKWSTFVIWAKHTFTLGRADYQRQYEPILYGWREGSDHYWCGARDQGDVWFVDKPARNDLHPTMKPVALVERAIRNSSKSRDIVLDPFGGSGSTLIACEKTGRQAGLIELDPKYVDTIILRWQAFSGGDRDPGRRRAELRRDRRRARGRGGLGWCVRRIESGSVPSSRNRAVLPRGTRPSSSRTWSQSSGMNGSAQASGRSGRQPARRLPNTPSSLMPAMVRMAMPSVRSSSASAWSRSARVRPRSLSRASASGCRARGAGSPGAWVVSIDHRSLPQPTIR